MISIICKDSLIGTCDCILPIWTWNVDFVFQDNNNAYPQSVCLIHNITCNIPGIVLEL